MPDDHPKGRGNCNKKCKKCGYGLCPGTRGGTCAVQSLTPFAFPDILNGADPPAPLPKRQVGILKDAQATWMKTNGKNISYAEAYYSELRPEEEALLFGNPAGILPSTTAPGNEN